MSLREQIARYLRQRAELGEHELFLDSLTARELDRLVRSIGDAPPAQVATSAPEAPAATPTPVPHEQPAHPRPAADDPPAVEVGTGPVVGERSAALRVLAEEAAGCPRCRLSETRTNVVFGDGTVGAEVVVVGEAPGADEDRTGVPFVGRAGRMLDLMLQAVGFPRERVYICNVLKCRPPGNRDPMADEVESCVPYLRRQIELIRPRVLLAVGRFAAQTLVGRDAPLGRMRGQVHGYQGVPVVATYHPAYLLRSPDQVRRCWDDLQLLRRVFDESAASADA